MARTPPLDALLDALNEGRYVDEPPINQPWSPVGVMEDEARVNENLRSLFELENLINDLKSLQIPDLLPPEQEPPGQMNFLDQPVQFAALPEAIADFFAAPADEDLDEAPQSFEDFLAAVPLAQAEDLAQAFMAAQMPQTFEGFLEDVPLEQANVLQQAYQAQNMPLPVRSPFEMPLPVKSPYSMPLPVKSPFSMPLPAKSPVSMALPVKSPIDIQVANLANIGLPPADLEDIDAQAQVESLANIGLTPAEMAALEQAENFANIGLPAVPESNVAAFAVPALADVMAQEQAANLANIGLAPEDIEALEQAENFANIGLESVPQSNVAAFAVPALANLESVVTLMPAIEAEFAAPLTEQDLADIATAEAEASPLSAPLSVAPLGTTFGAMTPALAMSTVLTPPVNSPMNVGIASHESAQAEQAPFGSSLAEISNPAVIGSYPGTADFSALMSEMSPISGDEAEVESAFSTLGDPIGLSAAISAASVAADPVGSFSEAALGFDPLSDPISSVDPAAADDSGDDDDSSAGIDLSNLSALTAIGDVDVAPAADESDPGADAGADASDVSAPSDPGGGSGLGDAFGDAFSDAFSDPAWWKGGRVFKRGKANGGPVGLAALPPPPMDHMEDMPPEGEKVSKAEAEYQSKPNGRERCELCAHYMDGACSIVKGRISPDGWSKFFEPA